MNQPIVKRITIARIPCMPVPAKSRFLDRLLSRVAEATGDLCPDCDAKIQEAARLAFADIMKGSRRMTTMTDLTPERLDEIEE